MSAAEKPAPMDGRDLGQPGQRVRLVRFAIGDSGWDDNKIVPPGSEGTIKHIDALGTRCVSWDSGSSLSLLADQDEWEVLG